MRSRIQIRPPLLVALVACLWLSREKVALGYNCNSHPQNRRNLLKSAVQAGVTLSTIASFKPLQANALSPGEASAAYDSYAKNYDALDGGDTSSMLGIDQARSLLFQQASGNVLEIGAGTGLNLDKYDYSKLKSLTLVDISEGMLEEAKLKASAIDSLEVIPFKVIQADATSQLVDVFGKESFDTVVDSFSLCVMGSQGAKDCVIQLAEVVKTNEKGGQVLLLENSRSSNPLLGMYQDATAQAAASIGGKGCVYNQDVSSIIRSTGKLKIEREDLYAAGLFRAFRCVVLP